MRKKLILFALIALIFLVACDNLYQDYEDYDEQKLENLNEENQTEENLTDESFINENNGDEIDEDEIVDINEEEIDENETVDINEEEIDEGEIVDINEEEIDEDEIREENDSASFIELACIIETVDSDSPANCIKALDAEQFSCETAYLLKSTKTSQYVTGTIEISYTGSFDYCWLFANFVFYDKNNSALFNGGTYLLNASGPALEFPYINTNGASYISQEKNKIYCLFIEKIDDLEILEKVEYIGLSISGSDFYYAEALGSLEMLGIPYKTSDDSWCIDIKNTGDCDVDLEYSCFIYQDENSRPVYWTNLAELANNNGVLKIAETGALSCETFTPPFFDRPLDFYDSVLLWQVVGNKTENANSRSIIKEIKTLDPEKEKYLRKNNYGL